MAPLGPAVAGSPWRVDVNFVAKGVLHAEAQATLELMPEEALRIITHPAGDELFRVVSRRTVAVPLTREQRGGDDGEHDGMLSSVEVENRAPVRIVAYKFWAISRVQFDVRLAQATVPEAGPIRAFRTAAISSGGRGSTSHPGRAGSSVTFKLLSSNMLKQLSGGWRLEPLFGPPGCGVAKEVVGTRLSYEHDVQPKGLPPGVQYVPGMSGAVCTSVAKEVRQMVDKIAYVADKVSRGLPVVAALEQTVEELRAAGGSFKKLQAARQRRPGALIAASRGTAGKVHLKSVPLLLDVECT